MMSSFRPAGVWEASEKAKKAWHMGSKQGTVGKTVFHSPDALGPQAETDPQHLSFFNLWEVNQKREEGKNLPGS